MLVSFPDPKAGSGNETRIVLQYNINIAELAHFACLSPWYDSITSYKRVGQGCLSCICACV